MSSVRKLFIHFTQFFSVGTLGLLLGFATFPILTRLLTREEYGILGLVTNTVAVAVALAKGGISDAIVRYYREHAAQPERLYVFTSTVLTRGALLSAVVTVLYVLLLPLINHLAGVSPRFLDCFLVMALYVFVRPLHIIAMRFLSVLGRIFLLNVVEIFTKVFAIVLGLALLLWVIGELYGYFLGLAIAETVAMIVLYREVLKEHRFSIRGVSGPLTVDLVKFGFPLLLTELSYLLLFYTDRYLIVAYYGEDMLGLYAVGYNVPAYINDLIMFSLSYAVIPIYTELYVKEGKHATEIFLSRCLNYYLMAVIPLCVGYSAVSHDALVTLASRKYADAAGFSPIVLVGLVCLGMNSILYAGLYLEKKSGQILAVMLSAVAINIAANVVMLPRYGATGAAMATLIACVACSLLMAVLGRRYLHIKISLSTIIYYCATSAAMYFIITEINTGRPWLNLLARVPLGVILMSAAAIAREDELRMHALRLMRAFSGRRA